MRIGVYRNSIRETRSRISVWFVERINVCPVFSVQMYEDNMGPLQLSGTTAFSSRTKHICMRYHFLRELVALNKIIVSHVKTTDQLADIFTKFLDHPKFKAILDKIVNFAFFHQHLYHLYWGAYVCFFIAFCMRCMFTDLYMFQTCAHIHAFQVFVIRDFYLIHSDMSFWSMCSEYLVLFIHKNHIIRTCLMYHASCKVEFQPFQRSYSQLMFFN